MTMTRTTRMRTTRRTRRVILSTSPRPRRREVPVAFPSPLLFLTSFAHLNISISIWNGFTHRHCINFLQIRACALKSCLQLLRPALCKLQHLDAALRMECRSLRVPPLEVLAPRSAAFRDVSSSPGPLSPPFPFSFLSDNTNKPSPPLYYVQS